MAAQSAFTCDGGQLADLLRGVDGAVVGRDGERDHRRLRVVRVAPPCGVERVPQRRRRETRNWSPVEAAHRRPATEHRRGSAFALQDVRGLVAQDRTPRRAQRGQCQRVGRSSADHGEDLRIGVLEDLANLVARIGGPLIGAVRQSRARVGGRDRRHDLGCGAGCVVAAELDGRIHPFVLACAE